MKIKNLSNLLKTKYYVFTLNHNVNIKKISQRQQLVDYKKNFNFIKKNFNKTFVSLLPFGDIILYS